MRGGVCEESTGAHDSKREILKNVTQRVSARKVAFKNDTQKPNTDTPAINLIEMNTRVRPLKHLFLLSVR